MNANVHAIRAGVSRGRTEFRNSVTSPQDAAYYIFTTGIFLTVIILSRNSTVAGTDVSLGTIMLPGVLGLSIVISAVFGLSTALATEREDGTLLRLKSLPRGMVGYVTGQVVRCSAESLFSSLVLLIPATFVLDNLWRNGFSGVIHVVALFALGLLATIPLGIVIGSIFKNPRSVGGWGMLIMGGLVWVSGIFSPVTLLADWLQSVAQVFPMYWLGLGMRSALLPDSAAVVEIGGSWRIVETFAVLGAWAAIGLLLAPVLLRRMARNEAGSSLEEHRQKALQRV